jgi:hypothetical protein
MSSLPSTPALAGVAELSGACSQVLGILAAEGPSLERALGALADPEPRSRYVLACTAGALRPLVGAGIAPDAVVLGVEEPDLEAILGQLPSKLLSASTLVVPAVLQGPAMRWWQGPIRLTGEGGGDSAQHGSLGVGRAEERAHRLLRHVGCDPVVLVGVDPLGIDGAWHARGTALDSAWSAQLNPFLTLATLEWRLGVQRREFHDAAMRRVRAFVAADRDAGLRVVDAGAGTVPEAMIMPMRDAVRRFGGTGRPLPLPRTVARPPAPVTDVEVRSPARVTAVVVACAAAGGTGIPRSLESEFGGRAVLARTVARVASAPSVERIVVLADDPASAGRAVARAGPQRVPVEVEAAAVPLRGPEAHAIAVSRLWCDSMWGGGIGGTTVFDEMLAPAAIAAALEARRIDGALVVGGDWPLVLVDGGAGIEDVAARFQAIGRRGNVFGDAPPGLSPC